MRHSAATALLQRQARLGAVKRLDLALFVDRQHDSMRRRIDVEADDLVQFGGELRIVGQLELVRPVRLQAMLAPDALPRTDADTAFFGHGGSCLVSRFRSSLSRPNGGIGKRIVRFQWPAYPRHSPQLPANFGGRTLVGGFARRIGERARDDTLLDLDAERQDARPAGLVVCIPEEVGQGFRFDVGHSDLKSATPQKGWSCPTAGQVSGLPSRQGERGDRCQPRECRCGAA
jgi:hypothetical protein